MGDKESLKKYETLAEYATRVGVNTSYLQGAIHANKVELPLVAGCFVVDEEIREILDPLADNIKSGMVKSDLTGKRGGKRQLHRKAKTTA